ncbi:hypothetical protein F4678DRAFT_415121 [Xylaria arbuscula]|nr:hypothetical protein F4678DRAFT_415121 [Xylaria arbuscula]
MSSLPTPVYKAFDGVICVESAFGCVEIQSCPLQLESQRPAGGPPILHLCADTSLFWGHKRPLTVSFLDTCRTPFFTDGQVKALVKDGAEDWTCGTNLCFKFLDAEDPDQGRADIRISFQGSGTYSVVGTTFVQFRQPTMNLGLRDIRDEKQITRIVLHEFGHALGFQHEHSSPNCSLQLDRETIMKDYEGKSPRGISLRDWVDRNFVNRLESGGAVEASPFDEYSIMMYPIQRTWNTDGVYIEGGSHLSDTDRQMVRNWYPPRIIRRSSTPGLSFSPFRDELRLSMINYGRMSSVRHDGHIAVEDFRCDKPECLVSQCDKCFRHMVDPERRMERYEKGYA